MTDVRLLYEWKNGDVSVFETKIDRPRVSYGSIEEAALSLSVMGFSKAKTFDMKGLCGIYLVEQWEKKSQIEEEKEA